MLHHSQLLAFTLALLVSATGATATLAPVFRPENPPHLRDFTVDPSSRCQTAIKHLEKDPVVISCGLSAVQLPSREVDPKALPKALRNFCNSKCRLIYQVVLHDLSQKCTLGPVPDNDFAKLNQYYVESVEAVCAVDSESGKYCLLEAYEATKNMELDLKSDATKAFLCSGSCGFEYAGPLFLWLSRAEALLVGGTPSQFQPKEICRVIEERSTKDSKGTALSSAVNKKELLLFEMSQNDRNYWDNLSMLRNFFLNNVRIKYPTVWQKIFEKDLWKTFKYDGDFFFLFGDKYPDIWLSIKQVSPNWEKVKAKTGDLIKAQCPSLAGLVDADNHFWSTVSETYPLLCNLVQDRLSWEAIEFVYPNLKDSLATNYSDLKIPSNLKKDYPQLFPQVTNGNASKAE